MSTEKSSEPLPCSSTGFNSIIAKNYHKTSTDWSSVVELKSSKSAWILDDLKAAKLSEELQNLSASRQENKIRRPANSFILFAKDNRKIIKKLHPSYTNNQVSCLLGEQWRNADSKTKEEYCEKAKVLSKIHKDLYPDYVYSPSDARKQKAVRDLSRLIRKPKPRSSKEKQSVLQVPREAISDACDILSYKTCVSSTTNKVQDPNPWQIVEFKLETEDTYPFVSTEADVETCNAEIIGMEHDYAIVPDLNKTEHLSDETAQLNLEEPKSNTINISSDTSHSVVDDNTDINITSTSEMMEPVDLSCRIARTDHEMGTSVCTVRTSTAEENNEVIGPVHGDVPFENHDIQSPLFSTHYPSATVGAYRIPDSYCVSRPVFDARVPYYPLSLTPYYGSQHPSFMPNSAYTVSPYHVSQVNTGSSTVLPSFATTFSYSRPLYSSFQEAAPHYDVNTPDYASSYVSSYPFQPSSQGFVPRYNASNSEHVEAGSYVPSLPYRSSSRAIAPCYSASNSDPMEAESYVPHLPYRSSSRAVAPRHNVHFSNYVPAEGSMPPQALIPPNYCQSEDILPYDYSARIPTVILNENHSAENVDRSRNNLHSVTVTQSGN